MSRDAERLEALRRITVKRGATKAEAATAKCLAEALKAKIGKRPPTRRRRSEPMPLPEPTWARKRRIWGDWLEWLLWRAGALCAIAIAVYFLLTPAMLFIAIFGGKAMEHHADNILEAKFTIAMAICLFGWVVMPPLAIALWWLRAESGTRLRTAAKFICYATPGIALLVLWAALISQVIRVTTYSGIFWPWGVLATIASLGVL
jgi:hypothetical protein